MIRQLTTLAILISPVCLGQVDGKGMFCSNPDGTYAKGWFFLSGEVIGFGVVRDNDEFVIVQDDGAKYWTDSTTVKWTGVVVKWSLNRRTLLLSNFINWGSVNYQLQCELYPDQSTLEIRVGEYQQALQAEYDRTKEGNLI